VYLSRYVGSVAHRIEFIEMIVLSGISQKTKRPRKEGEGVKWSGNVVQV